MYSIYIYWERGKERETEERERECVCVCVSALCVCIQFIIINNHLYHWFPGTIKMGNHILNISQFSFMKSSNAELESPYIKLTICLSLPIVIVMVLFWPPVVVGCISSHIVKKQEQGQLISVSLTVLWRVCFFKGSNIIGNFFIDWSSVDLWKQMLKCL